MYNYVKSAVVFAIAVWSASLIGCQWLKDHRATSSVSLVETKIGPRVETGWIGVKDGNGATASEVITDRALTRLVEAGVERALADELAGDLRVMLGSSLSASFDGHHELMLKKGSNLDAMAKGYVEYVRGLDLYKNLPDGFYTSWPVIEQVRYLWEHPDPRGVRHDRVSGASVTCGIGLVGEFGIDWPHTSYAGQTSLYCPKNGRLDLAKGGRVNKSAKSAWVQFEAVFANDMKTHVRIVFYYDDELRCWIPVWTCMGGVKGYSPLPML